jgi:DNA polymerase-4
MPETTGRPACADTHRLPDDPGAGPAPRIIAHLDMDAFYAAVELLRHPELRGLPVVIGGRRRIEPGMQDPAGAPVDDGVVTVLRGYAGRGVITTATYEARALGLHSGMGLMKAARLAPAARLLPADFDRYRHYSRLFKDAVRALAPAIEDRGIDEIYIDFTPLLAEEPDGWRAAAALAARLQAAVLTATGLSCSIGVTPNKLLSKIASDLRKPGGITVLTAADVPARIWPLAVRRINGIGPKAGARLETLGIRTIGELAAADPGWLVERFGRSFGRWLHEAAHGRDERPVVTFSAPKSISRETTFERDLHAVRDRTTLSALFTSLCEKVAEDLRRKGYAGRTIGLKLRFDDFSQVTRDRTIEHATQDARTIRRAAGECLKRAPLQQRLRLIGVRIGGLCPAQPSGLALPADDSTGTNRTLFD